MCCVRLVLRTGTVVVQLSGPLCPHCPKKYVQLKSPPSLELCRFSPSRTILHYMLAKEEESLVHSDHVPDVVGRGYQLAVYFPHVCIVPYLP